MKHSMTEKMTGKRNGKIDLLRFLFAVIIVLHHTRYLFGDEHCFFLGGSLAVEFFFIVSGYLMTAHAARETAAAAVGKAVSDQKRKDTLADDTVRFIFRKLRVILPVFLPAWIIGFFFVTAARHLSPAAAARYFCSVFYELSLIKMSGIFIRGLDGVIWYVSAMLLCMAVLYPLLRRFPEMMPKVAAPLLVLFLYGFLCRTYDHPRNPTIWTGIVYKGIIRSFADLCLGIVCFTLCRRFRRLPWNRFASFVFAGIEFLCYAAAVAYMYFMKPSQYDYLFIFLLCAAILLSFSGVTAGNGIFAHPVFQALGKYSTALFFSHIYYAQNLNRILPESMGRAGRLGIYLLCAFGTAFAVELFSRFLHGRKSAIMSQLGRLFFKQETR